MAKVILGTRGSKLALAQSGLVKTALERARPGTEVELRVIVTHGDRAQTSGEVLPKGAWVDEIEAQLADGSVDIAVHSMKDLPADLRDGLAVLAVPAREDPRDVLLTRRGLKLAQLPKGSSIGTASLRRKAMLLASRPDLDVRPIRGNVDTRVRKLLEGEVDGVVLAQAGLTRLGMPDLAIEPLDVGTCLPAPGQGALAIEGREDRDDLARLLAPLDDASTAICVRAERAFLKTLGGSCKLPLGALARYQGAWLELDGMVATTDGKRALRSTLVGDPDDAAGMGTRLAKALVALGAADIIAQCLGDAAAPRG